MLELSLELFELPSYPFVLAGEEFILIFEELVSFVVLVPQILKLNVMHP